MMNMQSMQSRIEEKITNKFQPTFLKVVNESGLHKGHAGDDGSGESHFHVEVVSPVFEGMRSVDSHRMIYDCLSDEMKCVHSLSILATSADK